MVNARMARTFRRLLSVVVRPRWHLPLLLIANTVLVAVASTTSEAQTLRLGIDAADAATLDPHFAATRNDRAVMDMVFNGRRFC